MKIAIGCFVGLGLVLSAGVYADTITHGATSVTIDFVEIGNPGNVADTTGDPNPCGQVNYTYRIGRYEVSENQWDAVSGASGSDLLDDPGYWAGDQPVAAISWHETAMFCNWLTSGDVTQGAYTIDGSGLVTGITRAAARSTYTTVYVIPTEDEWYKAAYYDPTGSVYWNYPTGNDTVPTAVASGTAADTAVYDGQAAPADIALAGGLSPYGTMGQGGNVWEWNETLIGGNRGVRGGSFIYRALDLQADIRSSSDPPFESNYLGFRVASLTSVPEPTSFVLLTLAGLGMVARRRRVAC